jgi:mitogen-activated protein kinase kinase kinase 3
MVLVSQLCGSPLEDDSVIEGHMSDISASPHSKDDDDDDEQSQASDYSLQPRPLFSRSVGADGFFQEESDNDSEVDSKSEDESQANDDSESSTEEQTSPDIEGRDSDKSIEEEELSVESEAESVVSTEEGVEEEEEFEDEYVPEDSSDTEDEDEDQVVEESPVKKKHGRARMDTNKAVTAEKGNETSDETKDAASEGSKSSVCKRGPKDRMKGEDSVTNDVLEVVELLEETHIDDECEELAIAEVVDDDECPADAEATVVEMDDASECVNEEIDVEQCTNTDNEEDVDLEAISSEPLQDKNALVGASEGSNVGPCAGEEEAESMVEASTPVNDASPIFVEDMELFGDYVEEPKTGQISHMMTDGTVEDESSLASYENVVEWNATDVGDAFVTEIQNLLGSDKNVVDRNASDAGVFVTEVRDRNAVSSNQVEPTVKEDDHDALGAAASARVKPAGHVGTEVECSNVGTSEKETSPVSSMPARSVAESESSLHDKDETIDHTDRSIGPSIEASPGQTSPFMGTAASPIAIESSIPEQVCSDGETDQLNVRDRCPKLRRFRSEGAIKRGKWSTGAKIGVGSFGVVRVGMNRKTGTLMAVKSIAVGPAVIKDIQTEIDLLKSLDHINIVRYLGAETDGTHLHIFQEWVPGGSVTSLLQKFGPFSMQVVRAYLFQILSGLAYLHDNHILHRDIKGGNVLVNDAGIVKLADFGSSKRLAQHQLNAMENLTMRGTPYFMAPEVFEEKYGSKADIWSVGCVAFQMATASPPWNGMGYTNPISLFLHIKDSKGIPSFEWPSSDQEATTNFKTLLEKCFYRDPNLRPSAKDLFKEAFFMAEVPSSTEDESRGLFSPGGESHSTWGSMRSPKLTVSRLASASLLSPPLPTRIHQGAMRQDVVSPLPPSPVVDASEWPSWARDRLENRKKSPYKRPPSSPSRTVDSLAVSEDSSVVDNPFRRRKSGDSSLSSSLVGLEFLDGKTSSKV